MVFRNQPVQFDVSGRSQEEQVCHQGEADRQVQVEHLCVRIWGEGAINFHKKRIIRIFQHHLCLIDWTAERLDRIGH